jgi:hypothetical protein
MSDLSAIGVTGALFISGTFVIYYFTAKINNRGHEIVTGVIAGVPLSVRYRTFLLWTTWLPQWAGAVAASLVFTSLFVAIADLAGGVQVRRVAYLCAGAAGFSALFWLVFGIPYIGLLLSEVRETDGS